MTSKHTPGPWILAESVENRFSKTDMRRVRAANEGAEHGAVCEVYGVRDGSTACANARLIAAAPELLEALVEATACGMAPISSAKDGGASTHSRQVRCADMIRAAIAKATGASPAPTVAPREEDPPCPGCLDTECNGECMENL